MPPRPPDEFLIDSLGISPGFTPQWPAAEASPNECSVPVPSAAPGPAGPVGPRQGYSWLQPGIRCTGWLLRDQDFSCWLINIVNKCFVIHGQKMVNTIMANDSKADDATAGSNAGFVRLFLEPVPSRMLRLHHGMRHR